MEVVCELFGPLRSTAGQKTVTRSIDSQMTVRDFLDELVEEIPNLRDELFDGDELQDSLTITVNGIHLEYCGGSERELSNDDVIRITPPFVGG